MGTTTWDKKFIKDAELSYSRVKFAPSRKIFSVHRDLYLRAGEVEPLARALANSAADPFLPFVSDFLRNWAAPPPPPPTPNGALFGLSELADLLELPNSPVFRNRHLRFGISPIPKGATGKPDGTYFLEIRLMFHFGSDVGQIALPNPDRLDDENLDPGGTPRLASPHFHSAIDWIASHTQFGDFLHAVFPNTAP